MWLSDRLKEYIQAWQSRDRAGDLAPGTFTRVKLEPEIKALQSFGKRAYAAEMTRQRQIIDDHLGGACHPTSPLFQPTDRSFRHSKLLRGKYVSALLKYSPQFD